MRLVPTDPWSMSLETSACGLSVARLAIDGVEQRIPLDKAADVLADDAGAPVHGAALPTRDMRRDEHVRQPPEWTLVRERLHGGGVQPRPGDLSGLQRRDERLLVHQPAARNVD